MTLSLSVSEDSGFSFGEVASSSAEIVLIEGMRSTSVLVRSSTAIGVRAAVGVDVKSTGLSVNAPEPLELVSVTPVVSVVFSVDGKEFAPGETLSLISNSTMAMVSLRLGDYELVEGQEAVLSVSVQGEGLTVDPLEVTLSGTTPSATVEVVATLEDASGSLTATAESGVALVAGRAELPVEVLALRVYSLSFDPASLEVITGGSIASTLSLTGVGLLPDEEVTVSLTVSGSGLSLPVPSQVSFSAGSTSAEVSLSASRDATTGGTLSAQGVSPLPLGVEVSGATAEVSVLPRKYALSFDRALLELVENATGTVSLSLGGDDALFSEESVTVSLSVAGAGVERISVSPVEVTFGPGSPPVKVEVEAATLLASVLSPATLSASVLSASPGIEVSGATLPLGILPRLDVVSLSVTPEAVEIERGRSATLALTTGERLVQEQSVSVTLTLPAGQGFSFDVGSVKEVRLDSLVRSVTVEVRSSSVIGSAVSVDVSVASMQGVMVSAPLPTVTLRSVTPMVSVVFGPADDPVGELSVPSGGEASVELSLDDYPLAEDQEIVLNVSVDGEGLAVSPTSVALTETSPTATVQVSASRRVESGNLVVSAASGAELVGGTQSLPVSVSPRQLVVSFDPSMVRLVRGGAAADTASTEAWLSVAPALKGDERLVLELTSGVAGNLGVNPLEATLSSETRAVTVTVTAGSGMASTEVVVLEGSGTSIGNAEVSFTPLTVEVVRGVELLISGVGGADAVSFSAGTSTELLVTTSPELMEGESVTVNLRAEGDGLTLLFDTVELSGAQPSARVSLGAADPNVPGQVAATGTGQNVGVVRGGSVGITTEPAKAVSVTFDPAPVRIERGRSATLTVGTSPPLGEGQSVSVSLSVSEDSGFSFGEGESSSAEIVLIEGMRSTSVLVRSSTAIGVRATVDVMTQASEGLSVNAPESLELVSVTPMVSVAFSVAGEESVPIGALVLPANSMRAMVSLSLEDYELAVGQEAVLAVSVQGEGLTVSTQQVTLSGTTPSATVEVTATLENAVGALTASAVSGVELRVDPARLPVSVEPKPEGLRLRIRVFLEGALE